MVHASMRGRLRVEPSSTFFRSSIYVSLRTLGMLDDGV